MKRKGDVRISSSTSSARKVNALSPFSELNSPYFSTGSDKAMSSLKLDAKSREVRFLHRLISALLDDRNER